MDGSSAGPPTDDGVSSHAAVSASPSDNYRQIGKRRGNGRLLLGAAHSYHASSVAALNASGEGVVVPPSQSQLGSVPSIPSRFETVLYSGDQEPDAFASRVSRFKSTAVDLPGPGAYAGDVIASNPGLKLASTSFSSKGYGVGFVSKDRRFKRRGGGPGPGAYDSHSAETLAARTAGSAPRGSAVPAGTAAFRPPMSQGPLDPLLANQVRNNNPGPGYYAVEQVPPQGAKSIPRPDQRRMLAATATVPHARSSSHHGHSASTSALSSASLAAQFQSSLSPDPAFATRDVRFRGGIGSGPSGPGSGAGPADYDPNWSAVLSASGGSNPAAGASHVFKSNTMRTDFTHKNIDVPGPGAYTKPTSTVSDEKTNDASSSSSVAASSPTRPFKPSSMDRFGRVLDPRVPPQPTPAPGSYDPYAMLPPGHLLHSKIDNTVHTSNRRTSGQAATISSPLVASQSHGLPVRSATAMPASAAASASSETPASSTKRKKRAAGVGGPGRSLLATRGGPGVALSSPALLLRPPVPAGTFGRAGAAPPSPAQHGSLGTSAPSIASAPGLASEVRPPGPSFYDTTTAFHETRDKKAYHLNTAHRALKLALGPKVNARKDTGTEETIARRKKSNNFKLDDMQIWPPARHKLDRQLPAVRSWREI